MGLKLNQFSSRILNVRRHSLLEGIVVQIFFLAILYGLIDLAYESNTGQVVLLYSGAAIVIGIAIVIDLYFIFSNLFSKNEKSDNENESEEK